MAPRGQQSTSYDANSSVAIHVIIEPARNWASEVRDIMGYLAGEGKNTLESGLKVICGREHRLVSIVVCRLSGPYPSRPTLSPEPCAASVRH